MLKVFEIIPPGRVPQDVYYTIRADALDLCPTGTICNVRQMTKEEYDGKPVAQTALALFLSLKTP